MQQGALVLCGGQSSRMGAPKLSLPFGSELMLQRVVRLVGQVVGTAHVVVVAAAGQTLPDLPDEVRVVNDRRPGLGPLEGLAVGLRAISASADAVYATSCDVPLLVPAFVRRLFELMESYDIVIPKDGTHYHPLAAVYRTSVLDRAERLLDADRRRPFYLIEECHTRQVPVDELRGVDPQLSTLANLNRPQEYLAAVRSAGFEPSPDISAAWGDDASQT